jgi:hypothetical protein
MTERPADTITVDEWANSTLEDPLERLTTQWPWLTVEVIGDDGAARIEVKSKRFAGSVMLYHAPHGEEGVWVAGAHIGSAATMGGQVADARVHLREALAVCDALDTAVAMLRGVRVWWP